ncbi:MAG: tyrosine-type recombinase/integrase [Bacteroidales bacterium]|nr:tyrosine-type recombinase/integrase [Bacteroidales bacterium]
MIDLERRVIKHLQVKGHAKNAKMLTIPISDGGMAFLEKWKGKNENYVFGILGDEFDLGDCELLKETLNAKNKAINTSLKTLGEKIKLPFSLHFHISRHTFATIGLNRGVDIKTISTLMGHSSVLITEKVYASVLPSTLEQAVEEKLNFKF